MDFDAMAGHYFEDLDFLFNPEFYNPLSAEEKERFSFSEGLFGVINKMMRLNVMRMDISRFCSSVFVSTISITPFPVSLPRPDLQYAP